MEDEGTGQAGQSTSTSTDGKNGGQQAAANQKQQAGTGETAEAGQSGEQEGRSRDRLKFNDEQQAFIDRLIDSKIASERTKAAEQAEAARLEEQGKYQDLYEKQKAKLEKLGQAAKVVERLSALINANIDEEIDGWPKEVAEMDPGEDDVEARLKWLSKSRALAARLSSLDDGSGEGSGESGSQTQNKPPETESGKTSRAFEKAGAKDKAGKEESSSKRRYRFQQPGDVTW